MRILIPAVMIFGLALSLNAQKESASFPSNGILITPLMGLINDQIPSIYYKRYLVNDSTSYLNVRIGTEILNTTKHEFSAGWGERHTSFNWKLGMEYGVKFDRSSLYFGGEMSRTLIYTPGAYILPKSGALFSSASYDVRLLNARDRGSLRIFSLHAFVGFKYHLNQQFSIGTEAALGFGWAETNWKVGPEQVPSSPHNSRLIDFNPVRFISLEYSF